MVIPLHGNAGRRSCQRRRRDGRKVEEEPECSSASSQSVKGHCSSKEEHDAAKGGRFLDRFFLSTHFKGRLAPALATYGPAQRRFAADRRRGAPVAVPGDGVAGARPLAVPLKRSARRAPVVAPAGKLPSPITCSAAVESME